MFQNGGIILVHTRMTRRITATYMHGRTCTDEVPVPPNVASERSSLEVPVPPNVLYRTGSSLVFSAWFWRISVGLGPFQQRKPAERIHCRFHF
jgi:hypothetical protein